MHARSTFKESKGSARNVKTLTAFFVRVVTLPLKKEVWDFWVCLSPLQWLGYKKTHRSGGWRLKEIMHANPLQNSLTFIN